MANLRLAGYLCLFQQDSILLQKYYYFNVIQDRFVKELKLQKYYYDRRSECFSSKDLPSENQQEIC